MENLFDDLVLLKDAPKELGLKISEKTLRNWRSERVYPTLFVRLGGSVFLRKSELNRIIRSQLEEQLEDAKRFGTLGLIGEKFMFFIIYLPVSLFISLFFASVCPGGFDVVMFWTGISFFIFLLPFVYSEVFGVGATANDSPTAHRNSPQSQLTKPISQPMVRPRSNSFIVYHGTPSLETALGIIARGFRVGENAKYGSGFYTTTIFSEAAGAYANSTGYVIAIHLNPNTPVANYADIPGTTVSEKQIYAKRIGIKMTYIENEDWLLIYGDIGSYVKISGYMGLELYDCAGKKYEF